MDVRTILAAGLLIALAACALPGLAAEGDQVPWAADYLQACQQAAAEGKLVLLHFYSDDCPPCVRVERNVFTQAEVGAAIGRQFVPVKVHARKSPELVDRYRMQQWPTDVFVTSAGQEITRSVSPQAPRDYINLVSAVAANAQTVTNQQPATAPPAATTPAPQNTLPPAASAFAPWVVPGATEAIGQAGNQVSGQAAWMAQGAAATAQQFQQSAQQYQQTAQQYQQSAQQYQQTAQQVAQQTWQQAQSEATQAPQIAQQSTQAAADAAKEVLNRYSQPLQQAATISPVAPAQNMTTPGLTTPPSLVAAAGSYPIAMEGYCPVTLTLERKWKKGQPQFGARHRGRTFLFSTDAAQQKFLAEPDRYTPVMVGYDPVKFMQSGELIDGRAAYSLTYRKEVYLFTDDASLKTFWQNPPQFTEGLRQAMIRAESGRTLR